MIIFLGDGPIPYGLEIFLMSITHQEVFILEMKPQISQTRYISDMATLGMLA